MHMGKVSARVTSSLHDKESGEPSRAQGPSYKNWKLNTASIGFYVYESIINNIFLGV